MRRVYYFTVIYCLVAFGGFSAAAQEVENFRGLRFGEALAEPEQFQLIKQIGNFTFYEREEENLVIMGTEVDRIVYGLYKGALYQVIILCDGEEQWPAFRDAVLAEYGEPTIASSTLPVWAWRTAVDSAVHKLLRYDSDLRRGWLTLRFLSMEFEEMVSAEDRTTNREIAHAARMAIYLGEW